VLSKVLVANRGAIALRIFRTLRRMGIPSVAVHSDADAGALYVGRADEAVAIGGAAPADSYLDADKILEAAHRARADGIHPGYGFLAENADFAARCEALGIAFIGPTAAQIRAFGLKHTARELATRAGLPLLPGTGLVASAGDALKAARRIGYPVMLKSTAGGGGIGMRPCASAEELEASFASVTRLAGAHFKDPGVYLEKLIDPARHVEVQIFGDGAGRVLALGQRDCSLQRRNQKVVEETPPPGLSDAACSAMDAAAARLGAAASYRSAGTVEFVVDARDASFYFLEVNTRIQVEHGVTEEVTGIDLVAWMVALAGGEPPPLERAPPARGAAIQARIYAEDPTRDFRPSAGVITEASFPADVRVEAAVDRGSEVSPHYDPLLAKVIASGASREEARRRLVSALERCRIGGVETNRAYLLEALALPDFAAGLVHTGLLAGVQYRPRTIEVVDGGTQTTVQDWPGRIGFWDIGVPPSGPMDPLSFRFANRLVGNAEGAAGLECTAVGPTLRFELEATIALTGADMRARLDGAGALLPRFRAVQVPAGGVVRFGPVEGAGSRAYLAVHGGLDVPAYLGSRSTFTLGLFGGHGGRALAPGDVLHVAPGDAPMPPGALPPALTPPIVDAWEIAVLEGPHAAPDFFTDDDIAALYATSWRVHHNSSRTGVRLIGPKPRWARPDGAEAGLHPSNIHDNAYAVGTIDFTGDMPILLGPDGPSLGGFVCPATVIDADLWKLGQLQADDLVRFVPVPLAEARRRRQAQDLEVATLRPGLRRTRLEPRAPRSPVLGRIAARADRPEVVIRQDGDSNLLVEYGPPALDLALRFRAHALMEALAARRIPGVVDLTPGIRSLQIHYDDDRLPRERLLALLEATEEVLPATDDIEVASRIVHLPLSWDDPATQLAIRKYAQSVRPDAPWCPSNIEFIRRINGLDSADDVQRIVYGASYLVLGLGDVYLGAPVATPLDPRHRLVTTKYNPARTWTPENAVGIGGAYLCIYGMEGPGGYQFVGRTCQVWNRFHETPQFPPGRPWLLRFFDQIRFFPTTERELLAFRAAFLRGRVRVDVEETTFRFAGYRAFLDAERASIEAFRARQRAAFVAERERWASLPGPPEEVEPAPPEEETPLPRGVLAVRAAVTGSIWEIPTVAGARVAAGDRLIVVESMKMETPIVAPVAGTVVVVCCGRGALVRAGQTLVGLLPDA
jgi:urea carboxylase